MHTNSSDFINLEVFAKAVADRLRDSIANSPTAKRVFTLEEAAEYCGLSIDSFKKKVIRDRVRRVRLDKRWRFDISDLNAWIESRKDEVAAEVAA